MGTIFRQCTLYLFHACHVLSIVAFLCFLPPSTKRWLFFLDTKLLSVGRWGLVLTGAAGGECGVPRLPEGVGVHLPRREPESRVPAVLQERPMIFGR